MKAGDKYIIEIEEVIKNDFSSPSLARIKGFETLVFNKYGLKKLEPYKPNDNKEYNRGLWDAWNCIRRISAEIVDGGLTNDENRKLFGTSYIADIVKNNTPLEVIGKVAEYDHLRNMPVDEMTTEQLKETVKDLRKELKAKCAE